jgi:hypothetical protein
MNVLIDRNPEKSKNMDGKEVDKEHRVWSDLIELWFRGY